MQPLRLRKYIAAPHDFHYPNLPLYPLGLL